MHLIGSPTSPFVRKVRVYLRETNTDIAFRSVDAWQPEAGLLQTAPIGKVPVLIRDSGPALFESNLVLEYLDRQRPEADRLLPGDGEPRWEVMRWQALAQGLIDSVVVRVLESRRDEGQRNAVSVKREEGRIARVLDAFEIGIAGRQWIALDRLSLADLVLGVALQYIDFRDPHDWRGRRPALAAWCRRVTARPCFQETLPPGFTPQT
jgi:glutathione S-transferase